MDFETLGNNVSRVIKNLDNIVLSSAMELKETIADLNVKQLEDGKRVDGANITPKYHSIDYDKAKKAIGSKSPPMVPDLKLHGDYHRGIYADRKSDYIYTWSKDRKVDKLNSYYPMHLGLTLDSIAIMKPDLTEKVLITFHNEFTQA